MIAAPAIVIRIFWRRMSLLISAKNAYYAFWFGHLATLLAVLCTPFETKYIAGYLRQSCSLIYHRRGEISCPLLNLVTTALFLLK